MTSFNNKRHHHQLKDRKSRGKLHSVKKSVIRPLQSLKVCNQCVVSYSKAKLLITTPEKLSCEISCGAPTEACPSRGSFQTTDQYVSLSFYAKNRDKNTGTHGLNIMGIPIQLKSNVLYFNSTLELFISRVQNIQTLYIKIYI